jgi:hypothetical protein
MKIQLEEVLPKTLMGVKLAFAHSGHAGSETFESWICRLSRDGENTAYHIYEMLSEAFENELTAWEREQIAFAFCVSEFALEISADGLDDFDPLASPPKKRWPWMVAMKAAA